MFSSDLAPLVHSLLARIKKAFLTDALIWGPDNTEDLPISGLEGFSYVSPWTSPKTYLWVAH